LTLAAECQKVNAIIEVPIGERQPKAARSYDLRFPRLEPSSDR